jgi:hypothetical protein
LRFERRVGGINADYVDLRRRRWCSRRSGLLCVDRFGLLSAGAEQDHGKDGQGRLQESAMGQSRHFRLRVS